MLVQLERDISPSVAGSGIDLLDPLDACQHRFEPRGHFHLYHACRIARHVIADSQLWQRAWRRQLDRQQRYKGNPCQCHAKEGDDDGERGYFRRCTHYSFFVTIRIYIRTRSKGKLPFRNRATSVFGSYNSSASSSVKPKYSSAALPVGGSATE